MLCRKVKRELAAEKLKVQGLENDVSKLETKVSNKNHIINAYKVDIKTEKKRRHAAVYHEQLNTSQSKLKLIDALDLINKQQIELNKIPDVIYETVLINPYPDISMYLDNPSVYLPFSDARLNKYEKTIADLEYNKFNKDTWDIILAKVYKEVKKAQVVWRKNVGDCDNWAESMHYYLSKSMLDAGMERQSAFGLAWSKTHAYNFYVTDKDIWMYEPQTGKTIAKMTGKYGELFPKFETTKIFFIS